MRFAFYARDLDRAHVDVLAIPVFEDGKEGPQSALRSIDRALDGKLLPLLEEEGFEGRADQTVVAPTYGAIGPRRIFVAGLGKSSRFDLIAAREWAQRVVKGASRSRHVALVVPSAEHLREPADLGPDERWGALLQALSVGASLGTYRFDKYRTRNAETPQVRDVTFCFVSEPGVSHSFLLERVRRGEHVADAVGFARDLVNEPAIALTPSALAEAARNVARRHRLECKVFGLKEIQRLKMGCFLGVSQGSAEEPRLIHLRYAPRKKGVRRVGLVGKGLTFDSGGLSLKPAKSMEDMKTDMAGAAAVLAAMRVVGELRPEIAVDAFIGATENMPGGRAIRPGDVLRSMSGRTVEVLNTDAEGRLVLADVLHYARTLKVDELVDVATLTGACMVALGRKTAGFFANDEGMARRWARAAALAGEDAWRMPLSERLMDSLKSNVADLKNIGDSYGGAITAALFLREFVGDTPWVHVDIAGPAFVEGKNGGATGYGVMTLSEYLLDLAAEK